MKILSRLNSEEIIHSLNLDRKLSERICLLSSKIKKKKKKKNSTPYKFLNFYTRFDCKHER